MYWICASSSADIRSYRKLHRPETEYVDNFKRSVLVVALLIIYESWSTQEKYYEKKTRNFATPEGTSHLKHLGYVHTAGKSDLNLIYFYLFILCCLNVSVFIKFDSGHLHVWNWTRYTAEDFERHLSLNGRVTWPTFTWLNKGCANQSKYWCYWYNTQAI